MEKFTPSELCADIKIYDYKKKVKYDDKSLVIFEKTGKMITAGKECEGMLYTLPADEENPDISDYMYSIDVTNYRVAEDGELGLESISPTVEIISK